MLINLIPDIRNTWTTGRNNPVSQEIFEKLRIVEAFFVFILFIWSVCLKFSELTKESGNTNYLQFALLILSDFWFGMAIAKFSTSISDRSLSVRMSDANVEYLIDRK